jgi:flagellar assembly protein FliH
MTTGDQIEINAFEYPSMPVSEAETGWNGFEEVQAPGGSAEAKKTVPEPTATSAAFDQRLTEETHRAFEAGRERGLQEGRQSASEAQSVAVKAAKERYTQQATELIASFTLERDRYLQTVEHEVVKLALAVAARILRREAQMDPLLLTGAVRVALGQLAATTEVALLVPAAEFNLWQEAVAMLPNLAVKPVVTANDEMRLGDCELSTSLGSVDLGIRAQLGEIERGFFDRPCAATLSSPQTGKA